MQQPIDFERQYKLYQERGNLSNASPAEMELEHILRKLYRNPDLLPEFEVGPYRLDFLTRDGVGWEVDGKNYHEFIRDLHRDEWILQNSDVSAIIRLAAASIHFLPQTCHAVFCNFLPHLTPSVNTYRNSPELILARAYQFEQNVDQSEELAMNIVEEPCFVSDDYTALVGYSGYWIPEDHEIWNFVDSDHIGRTQWVAPIRFRTLANRERWSD
jgi:hypothetical protein